MPSNKFLSGTGVASVDVRQGNEASGGDGYGVEVELSVCGYGWDDMVEE